MDNGQDRKAALRDACREAARDMTDAYRAKASADIRAAVLSLAAFGRARTVFVYVSMPAEPDTAGLIARALEAGKRVCVPRCGKRPRMDAVPIRSLAELRPGALGIPAPEKDAPRIDPKDIDLALIPCLAAGRDGERLGHGAGYYDAYLRGQRMMKVCLCFERMLREDIPMADTDARMDAVITERTIYKTEEGIL